MAVTFSSSSPLFSTKSKKFLLDRPFCANNYSSSPFVVVVKIPAVTTTRGRRGSSSVSCCCCRKGDSRERKVTHKIMEKYKKLHTYPGDEIDYILKEEDGATRWRWLTGGVNILSIMPPDEPRSGFLILVEALHREGVTDVFTNQDQSILLKALSATTSINTHTFLSHCSELLAATGYAMATRLPGVCMTSLISDGLTKRFVHGMAYAYEKNIPLVVMVVDGWEKKNEKFSSTRAEDCGRRLDETIKCRFSITSAKNIQKIVRKALLVARSGRPGPVMIDHISYDVVNKSDIPVWDNKEELPICPPPPLLSPPEPTRAQLEKVIGLLRESKRPLVYVGSGCFEWRNELTRLVELTGIPVLKAEVVEDTPVYLSDGDFSNFYSSPYNRFSVEHFDLLLAFDVRSTYYDGILDLRRSDSIILEFHGCEEEGEDLEVNDEMTFLGRHVQPGSISSIRCGDTKSLLQRLNHLLEEGSVGSGLDFSSWRKEINDNLNVKYPFFSFLDYVGNVLNEVTNRRDTFMLTYYEGFRVRFWDWFTRGLSSARNKSDYTMVVSLPLAAGAAIGKGRRTRTATNSGGDEEEEEIGNIIDVFEFGESDYNIEELVVVKRENLPVKVVILNHILTVREDERKNEAPADILRMARSLGIPCRRIGKKEEVRDAMTVMMETPGPYVLDIVIQDDPYYDENKEPELRALDTELFLFWLGHQTRMEALLEKVLAYVAVCSCSGHKRWSFNFDNLLTRSDLPFLRTGVIVCK